MNSHSVANCSICISPLNPHPLINPFDWGIEKTTTPCNHKFHKDCLIKWLREKGNCPNCRTLLGRNIDQIFSNANRNQQPLQANATRSFFNWISNEARTIFDRTNSNAFTQGTISERAERTVRTNIPSPPNFRFSQEELAFIGRDFVNEHLDYSFREWRWLADQSNRVVTDVHITNRRINPFIQLQINAKETGFLEGRRQGTEEGFSIGERKGVDIGKREERKNTLNYIIIAYVSGMISLYVLRSLKRLF